MSLLAGSGGVVLMKLPATTYRLARISVAIVVVSRNYLYQTKGASSSRQATRPYQQFLGIGTAAGDIAGDYL